MEILSLHDEHLHQPVSSDPVVVGRMVFLSAFSSNAQHVPPTNYFSRCYFLFFYVCGATYGSQKCPLAMLFWITIQVAITCRKRLDLEHRKGILEEYCSKIS